MKININLKKILLIILLFLGLASLTFPFVSQYYYYRASHEKINDFQAGVNKLSAEEINNRIALAKAYNASLLSSEITLVDPYSSTEKENGRREYGRMLEVNEQIGYVFIPKISQNLPMYVGTSEQVLQKGVGHLEGTSLPIGGASTHAVLSAHRGLPNAQLFTDLDKMQEGDVFYVHNLKETLAYQVDQISVIEPTELDKLKIEDGKDYVTLLTCTPYMINSHRLLVRGHRIAYDKETEDILSKNAANAYLWYTIFVAVVIILIMGIVYFIMRKKKNA